MELKIATLITGASSGLGLEYAKIFAREGHNLVLVARNEEKLYSLKNEFENKYDIEVDVFAKDLSEKDSALEVFNFTLEEKIYIDTLINNAGFGDFGEFVNSDLTKQSDMINVNVLSLMQLCRLYAKPMVERGSGMIMNMASTASFQPGPMMSVYYATKAFVLSFSEAISVELKNTGVSIMAYCPGPTKTGFETKARLETSGLFKHLKNATAEEVAIYGYKKMQKHKVVAIHGGLNKIITNVVRFTPRRIVRNIVYFIQK